MPIFRSDLYVTISIDDFNLEKSSREFYELLTKITDLRNLQMTKVTRDYEVQGKIRIEEWYEISGAIDVSEGGKAFWALCKEITSKESYNFFIRLDRNITATSYQTAQELAINWVEQSIIQPLRTFFSIKDMRINSPTKLSKKVGILRRSQ
ncbi:MAG: hypothetical protein ACFFDP_12635 [Promethearchaeota archaeon]